MGKLRQGLENLFDCGNKALKLLKLLPNLPPPSPLAPAIKSSRYVPGFDMGTPLKPTKKNVQHAVQKTPVKPNNEQEDDASQMVASTPFAHIPNFPQFQTTGIKPGKRLVSASDLVEYILIYHFNRRIYWTRGHEGYSQGCKYC